MPQQAPIARLVITPQHPLSCSEFAKIVEIILAAFRQNWLPEPGVAPVVELTSSPRDSN